MAILEVKEASFGYGRNIVLENINFQMNAGEVICLIGPNGSGKTTLLDCIMGILPLRRGKVFLQGKSISDLKAKEIARIISYVPQIHKKTFPYTVEEIVLMGRASHIGMFASPGNEDISIAHEAIETVGIKHLQHRPYTELSGGEGQLVMIARALAQQSRIMIMDEPTTYLDFQNSLTVLEVTRQLAKKRNLSIILATHYLNHAFYFENNGLNTFTAMLDKKSFAIYGRPNKVLTRDNINKIFNIDCKIIDYDSEEIKKQRYIIPIKLSERKEHLIDV
ncbi:MAG: ABC transporter ATP-binding protein [Candidatus Caldatribacteriota bacterium]|jgi:iron complex transport system ATP-binding protein|nr:ABC transporter ATP-binding protein [Atribacterota bacterium]MDD4288562.1 ABC transporter ATP-binding protein [Atribacterota bacterium]MDD4765836.1 ABC transporter ATP-binding protein [Atribacterota bacterium]